MKRFLFFVNCLLFSLCTFAQHVAPEFPGGNAAMKSYFAKNIRISEEVRKQGVSGKVFVRFIVQADGSIDSVRVVKSDYDFFNAEAMRVVKNMPKWKPGSINGKPVAVAFAVPINFKIEAGVDRNPTVPPSNVKSETIVADEGSNPYPTVTSVFGKPDEDSWVNVYLDNSAKKIYLNKYDTDYKFSDGMLCVRNLESGLCGFIDEKGNVLKGGFCWKSPRMYEYPRFVGGVAIVKKVIRDNGPYVTSSLGAEWYILDKNGETIRLDYDISEATDFNKDGIAGILVRQGFAAGSALAFINKKGEIVYQNASAGCNMLQSMRTFNDGLAAYYDDFSRSYGYLNKAGEEVLPAEYFYAGDFSEGLAVVGVYVQGAPKYVYINTKGEVAFDRHFTNRPLPFTKGYGVATKTNGRSVLINKNGEICSKEYRFITNFNPDGLAFASNGATIDVLDTDLKIVSTLGGDIFGFRFFEEYMNDFTSRYFNGVFWNGDRCFFDYKGNEVMIREGYNGDIKAVSQDGLYHVMYQAGSYDTPIDGFVDPKTGKYVFVFEKEEF